MLIQGGNESAAAAKVRSSGKARSEETVGALGAGSPTLESVISVITELYL